MGESNNTWVRYVVYAVLAAGGGVFLAIMLAAGVLLYYFW